MHPDVPPNGAEQPPGEGVVPPTPETQAERDGTEAAASPPPVSEPPEAKWDEIWRPRRQGRQFKRPEREKRTPHKPQEESTRGPRAKKGRPDHRERRREGPPQRRDGQRRDDRPRPYQHSAAPAPKGGIDPDSPFAALSSLKAALEKRSQD